MKFLRLHGLQEMKPTLTSVIVIIFAIIASLFFFLSDQVMSFFIRLILGLGS
jgi:hypothetical protein